MYVYQIPLSTLLHFLDPFQLVYPIVLNSSSELRVAVLIAALILHGSGQWSLELDGMFVL